jgi:hypothetical protein
VRERVTWMSWRGEAMPGTTTPDFNDPSYSPK